MSEIATLLTANTQLLWAAIVAAVVSAIVSYLFRRSEIRLLAKVEYECDQRKKLRELIGCHHGGLLHAANTMNYRLWNLYQNHAQGVA